MLGAAALAAAGAARIRQLTFNRQSYQHLGDVASSRALPTRLGQTSGEVNSPQGRLLLTKDKKMAEFDGIRCYLNFAPLVRGGVWYLSALDVRTTLSPLWQLASPPPHPVRVIVLDPGHGGKDNGASGRLYHEKQLTLRLAQKVRLLLQRAGYTVYLTRYSDMARSLPDRVRYANTRKASLFLSLHFNSAGASVRGLETYALTPAGASSTNSSQIETTRYPGNQYDLNNLALAYRLQRSLVQKTGAEDRGVKRARFAVLRDIDCPAALMELGFISNREEEKLLGNDAYLDKLARAIVDGVVEYHRSVYRKR